MDKIWSGLEKHHSKENQQPITGQARLGEEKLGKKKEEQGKRNKKLA